MKLTLNALQDKAWWQERGYQLPLYDIPRVRAATFSAPRWLHLGAGNIFRAFLAHAQQRLLNQRDAESGIIVAEGFDPEIIEKAYRPCDNLSIFVRLKGDRTLDKIVLASVVESLTMRDDFERLRDIAAAPSLQMISLTITEKGYAIKDRDGAYYPAVAADFKDGTARRAGAQVARRSRWSAWTTCRITAKNCAPSSWNSPAPSKALATSRPNSSPGWRATRSPSPGR